MPNPTGRDESWSATGLGRTAFISVTVLLLTGLAVSATLEENSLASQTVGPGAKDVVALNFTFQGDRVLDGVHLNYNDSSGTFGQDADWNISVFDDSLGGNWDSGSDYLALDEDGDGAYTSRNDSVINGNFSRFSNGDPLVEKTPFTSFAFVDKVDTGVYNASNDSIVQDFDNDSVYTSSTEIDALAAGTASEADKLMNDRPVDWKNVTFYNRSAEESGWNPANDTIVLENSTNTSTFGGVYNGLGDKVLAGNQSIVNGTSLTGTKPSDWTTIKFQNGSLINWSSTDDGIVNDTAGSGTFSTRNDSVINGTVPAQGSSLSSSNPFTGTPGIAFNDSASGGTPGAWNPGYDLIMRDYGTGTVSTVNDTDLAGSAPSDGTAYTNSSVYPVNWTLYSVDAADDGNGYDLAADSIVYDDDNSSVFGHQLNALTLKTSSSLEQEDVESLDFWAENNSDTQLSMSGDAKLASLDSSNYTNGRWVIDGLYWNFTSREPFYVTANISNDPINMPELQLEVPALNDKDGNGTLNSSEDEGFFVNGSRDTGSVTGPKNTIYTANITEVETIDTGTDQKADEILIRFSESVNVSGGLNLTNPDVAINSSVTASGNNINSIQLPLKSEIGGNVVTGIEYLGGNKIITYNTSYELTADNSTVKKIDGVNNAPSADAGGDKSVNEGNSLDLDCGSSTDPEGDKLDCMWKITSDPSDSATIDGEGEGTWVTGNPVTFDAPSVDQDVIVEVQLEVNDTELKDSAAFEIVVGNSQTQQTTTTTNSGSGGKQTTSSNQQQQQKQQEPTSIQKSVVIGRGTSKSLDIGAETVGSLKVKAASDADIVGSIKYDETGSRPSSVTSPKGKAYKYLQINKENFDNRQVENVEFNFKVSKSWIEDRDIAPSTVTLQRYESGWQKLPTSSVDEDSKRIYFNATSPGFSVFSITGNTYDSLFRIRDIQVSQETVTKGSNVTVEVSVENTAESRLIHKLEVDAGGKMLSRNTTLKPGEVKNVSFTTSYEDVGTKTISAGGLQTQVEVKSEENAWSTVALAVILLLMMAGATLGYIFWPEINEKLDHLDINIIPVMSSARERLIAAVPTKERDYSFEGFEEDEEFDYSFDRD